MAQDLSSIDASKLDELAKLEADQRAIQTLAQKAVWRRDKEVEVCTRVLLDYEARMAALVEQADAVRQGLRDDLEKLNALYEQHERALDQAKAQWHECEFRHEIGELADDAFQHARQTAERTIRERDEEFENVKKLRARYFDLLGESEPPPQVRAMPAPAAVRSAPASQPSAANPVASPAPTPPPPAIPAEKPAIAPDDATMFRPPPGAVDFRVPSKGKAAASKEASATISLNPAMLIHDANGLPGAHHALGASTTIGRTAENQIRIADSGVSRRHAEILLTENGYLVKDLGSPNGTFVNGERITEHLLKQGDRLKMGGQVFMFKAP